MDQTTYRIRTTIGDTKPFRISVPIRQTYDIMEILSLKIRQQNLYKLPQSEYGVVIGRVLANGNFGIPNAKISIFIPYSGDFISDKRFLYPYTTTMSTDDKGVRYNLLQTETGDACHQDVGSFPTKRYVLDNNDVIEVFEEFYTYTTSTNNAGDYMIYGVPTGMQDLHVDIDLSDIGVLSQSPRDMVYKGYDIKQFETPTKFRKSENLNSLSQILTQNQSVYVYPFWGDTTDSETNASITRCDIKIDYKFEPTCVFMGSVVTDSNSNFISKRCNPTKNAGKMSDLRTGEGMIEMIRKTPTNKVESFAVQGNRVIDGNGVWCYQIPMNLDYVMTDEFGNMVPTDDPENGIPTRTRVRFRLSMDELEGDMSGAKRARFLIPNNPEIPGVSDSHIDSDEDIDYEFGSKTKDGSFRDLFWNHVYTVKGYIPRLQKSALPTTRHFTGIKATNHYGDNNPMPYNNMQIRLNFLYRINCMIAFVIVSIVTILNRILTSMGRIFWLLSGEGLEPNCKCKGVKKLILDIFAGFMRTVLGGWLFAPIWKAIGCGIEIKGWCQSDESGKRYFPGCGKDEDDYYDGTGPGPGVIEGDDSEEGPGTTECPETKCSMKITSGGFGSSYVKAVEEEKGNIDIEPEANDLMQCIQSELSAENECVMMNFHNDWINGVLYLPLWARKIHKRRFNIFGRTISKIKDVYCNGSIDNFIGIKNINGYTTKVIEKQPKGLRLYNTCSQERKFSNNKLQPLDKHNPAITINDPITGIQIGASISSEPQKDCYGYNCDKISGAKKITRGIIVERDTILQENVYYYKPINTTDDDKVKLFATDIVLLGSLNNCDKNGTPQFFSKLSSTTYKMPPDIVLNDYDTYAQITVGNESIGGKRKLKIDEGKIPDNYKYAELSGADWGGEGYQQQFDFDQGVFLIDSLYERNTLSSGLFYGLNCNFTEVAPKSCVNMSRICEFGVGLDENMYIYNQDTDTEQYIAPDGFISTDEINDVDGRSMFATLNGNNLRTKTDNDTGYSVYDLTYSYQQYFDGSLSNIMREFQTRLRQGITYRNNYKLELYGDDYVSFRFGDNTTTQTAFYNSDLSTFHGPRIPKYNNSFYFYFGLKEGKTAIDKFRELYYNECKSDITEDIIGLSYKPNEWCDEIEGGNPEGFIGLDMTYVDTPYTINIDCRSDNEYDKIVSGITKPRIYIGPEGIQDPKLEGYDCLLDENEEAIQIVNGSYIITVIDANSEMTSFNVYLMPDVVSCDISHESFKISNEQLFDANNGYCVCVTEDSSDSEEIVRDYDCVARYFNQYTQDREIGGTITVSNISVDNFEIEIKPSQGSVFDDFIDDSPYTGDVYYSCNDTSEKGTLIKIENGAYTFGVPKGDITYIVTVTELCESGTERMSSRNIYSTSVLVEKYILPVMYINGIDSRLLKYFKTGYDNTVYPNPESLPDGIDYAKKWIEEIGNLGMTPDLIEYNIEDNDMPTALQLKAISISLTEGFEDEDEQTRSAYYWTGDYVYNIQTANEFINIPVVDRLQYVNGQVIPVDITEMTYNELAEFNWKSLFGEYPSSWPTYFKSIKSDGINYQYFQHFSEAPGGTYRLEYYQYVNPINVFDFYAANSTTNNERADFIDYLNSVITLRQELPHKMQLAFWKSGPTKDLVVTSSSTNLPKKYLVYGPTITKVEYTITDESTENNVIYFDRNPEFYQKVSYNEYPQNINIVIESLTYCHTNGSCINDGIPWYWWLHDWMDAMFYTYSNYSYCPDDIHIQLNSLIYGNEFNRYCDSIPGYQDICQAPQQCWHSIEVGVMEWFLAYCGEQGYNNFDNYNIPTFFIQNTIINPTIDPNYIPQEDFVQYYNHRFGILDANRETNIFSFDFGQIVKTQTSYDFNKVIVGQDNNDDLIYQNVEPYYCSTKDNADFIVPQDLSLSEFNDGVSSLDTLQGVMFFERPMTVGVVTWGAVNYPMVFSENGETVGRYIKKDGILDLTVYNGIINSINEYYESTFDIQTVDNEDIKIQTSYYDQNKEYGRLPVKRRAFTKLPISDMDYGYYPQICLNAQECYNSYIQIPDMQSSVIIDDGTEEQNDICYGNLKMSLNQSSLSYDIRPNHTHNLSFQFNIDGINARPDKSMIIVFTDKQFYPLLTPNQPQNTPLLFDTIRFDNLNLGYNNENIIIGDDTDFWGEIQGHSESPIAINSSVEIPSTSRYFFAVALIATSDTNVACVYTPLYEHYVNAMSLHNKTVSITAPNEYLHNFPCTISIERLNNENNPLRISKTNIQLEFDHYESATYTFTSQNWFNIGDSVRITVKDVTGLEHYIDTTVV